MKRFCTKNDVETAYGKCDWDKLNVSIPLEIDKVQTHRVADSLVRIIQYNMELTPRLAVELLEIPVPPFL